MKIILIFLLINCVFIIKSFSQTGNATQYKYTFTVAKDGTGDYKFIQDAIDAMRVYPLAPITLYIKNGIYNEKIELPTNNVDVSFIGENVDSTIITFNDYSGKGTHTTFTSYTAKISGNRFYATNITFANTAGRVGQALALYVDADKAIFKNCKFLGNQDTIYSSGETSHQLFDSCYVEGTTDFIFGNSTAIFSNCTIKCKANSFITAASTNKGKAFGLVFIKCNIFVDTGVSKVFLGRPWRAFAKTVFIKCSLPKQIAEQGWDNWGNIENEKTAFYAEHSNFGEGANTNKRVKWSKHLTNKELTTYTIQNIAKNNNWVIGNAFPVFDKTIFLQKKENILSLYNTIVPNNKNNEIQEVISIKDNVTRIAKVSTPTITIFKATKPNGKAVIICPGGGYTYVSYDKEGTRVAEELNRWGVTAFVLKYRTPNDSININKSLAPLQDAQQAIRFIRNNAKEFGVSSNQIGIMGFSAGGHLAATTATLYNTNANLNNNDTTSTKPNFAILIYPVISMDSTITHKGSRNNLIGNNPTIEITNKFSAELQVNKQTPPCFIVHASDDAAVPVQNSLRFYEACVTNKVPVEMHLYTKGGHGFGMYNKTTDDNWMDRLKNWLQKL